jgi:hypothetical protein
VRGESGRCRIVVSFFLAKNRVPSPPRHVPTKLVHVNHLTRPFTKGQLFEILTEDGPIVQEKFWTNKIKSHCIALVSGLQFWVCWIWAVSVWLHHHSSAPFCPLGRAVLNSAHSKPLKMFRRTS